MANPKLLFVGASGAVARKVIPVLGEKYDVVGVSKTHDELKSYCTDFFWGDLLREHQVLFERIFSKHTVEAIVWNAVTYLPGPMSEATRAGMHTEFDLAVALPLACLQVARRNGFGKGAPFILVSSQLAFGRKLEWGSYSIVKHAQTILASYLNDELNPDVVCRVVAPGSVPAIPDQILAGAFLSALGDGPESKTLYIVDESGIR